MTASATERSRSTNAATPAERAFAVFPGGSLGEGITPANLLFVLSRGEGATVWDMEGRSWQDFTMGWGSVLLGHAHPAVTEAVLRQAHRGSNFSHVNEPALELAEELLRAVPGAERVRFLTSGSEATLHAVILARAFTQRPKILKFEGGYHGSHDIGTLSLYPRELRNHPEAEPISAGTTLQSAADVLVAPFNDENRAAATLERYRKEVAAIIVEPLHRCIAPVPGFLQSLRTMADATGALLIFDEVVTGFRFAYGGAQEYYGVRADLVALGKALGGGYPIGAVVGRAEIMDFFDENREGDQRYAHLVSTLGGNPVSMVAALATLKELRKPNTYKHLFQLGERLRGGLRAVCDNEGVAAQVLGDGPIGGVAFAEHEIRDYRGFVRSDRRRHRAFARRLLERGIFLNPDSSKFYLSCAHTPEDIDLFLDAARETLREDLQ